MWTKLRLKTCIGILILMFFWGEGFSQSTQNDSLLNNLGNCLIRSLPDGVMEFPRPDTNDVFFVKTIVLKYSFNPLEKGEWTEIPIGYSKPVLFKKDNQGEQRQSLCNRHVDKLKRVWGEEDWSLLFVFDHFMLGPRTHLSTDVIASKVALASDDKVAEIIKHVEGVSELKKTIRLLFKVGPIAY